YNLDKSFANKNSEKSSLNSRTDRLLSRSEKETKNVILKYTLSGNRSNISENEENNSK
ncbi:hypothetical protein PMALA_042720, partial [Plasmodium malariae]